MKRNIGLGPPASAPRWAAAVANADWCVTGPLIVALSAAWDTDVATITMGVAAYSLGYGCALPLWGAAADRYGYQRCLQTGMLLGAIASAGSALSPGPGWWIALRMAAGASFAAVPPCVSLACESADSAQNRHRSFAGLTVAAAMAAVAAPPLAVLASLAASWRLPFLLVGLLAVATVFRMSGAPPDASPPRPSAARWHANAPAYRTVIALGAAEGAALLTLPALLAPSLALSGARTVTALAQPLYAVGVLSSTVMVHRHCHTWPPMRLLGVGGAAGAVGTALTASSPGPSSTLVCALLLGAAWGYLHTTLQTWLPHLVPFSARARASALFAAAAMLTSSLAIAVGTALLQQGRHTAVFAAGFLSCALLTCLTRSVARRWT
ncbi:MFS transporter [Streptomyces sp. A0958]|uniref:MFS transporter n=1 Tax=Streptomyces sp. A0958 TaxID=2563101 RepID=UPI00109E724A|nr:MFS transporter [Streptomyces sp. A0958]THA70099.1 MFS transporter [Streptomyces sp. A0958]